MRKGAMILFAFSIFYWGCQTRTIYSPPSVQAPSLLPPSAIEKSPALPDLAVSDITLDDQGRVVITLSNLGKGHIPSQSGELKIYVGGDLKWNVPLGAIPDQAFLQPGGVSVYTTPVELEGAHTVMAVVDSDRAVPEENESNNILAKVLTFRTPVPLPLESAPPFSKLEEPSEPLSYPDLTITDLELNLERKLVIHIANIGTGPFALREGTVYVFVDGVLMGSYLLGSQNERSHLSPQEEIALTTSLTILGRHEVHADIRLGPESNERNQENNGLKKTLDGLPIGPDLLVKELNLSEDFDLFIALSNAGDVELRKGTTLGVRIFMNGQKVSEFDHFISEPVKPYLGSHYVINPPYRVRVSANSRVKVVISPRQSKDDVRLENNSLERNFAIFPFRIDPQTSQEFSFDLSPPNLKESRRGERVKAEIRWDGGGAPLRLSLKGGTLHGKIPPVKGKSPLRLEVPIGGGENREGRIWRFSIKNLMEKRAEGHLIIQTP